MVDTDSHREDARDVRPSMAMSDIDIWFCREVLPLEATLMQYLRRNWANASDIADLRQDVYMRVYEAAQKQRPDSAKFFVLAIARNLLIDRVRRARVVPMETVTDLEALAVASHDVGADRIVMARDALSRLQTALEHLAPRAREAVLLSKVEGLSRRQIAQRMGIAEDTVKHHLVNGMHALAEQLYGALPDAARRKL
ncbi:MAG TPA: RNA polymerase sigma factor [Rhizomicrobium sp.]|jgi:RNA polymerase sigma factor (sigma-70 family)|nr:RNA polymerase sigma factor [Rhizomicrobium sp.]